MNQAKADQDVADKMTDEFDSRGEVIPNKKERSVIFEKKAGWRANKSDDR